MYLVCVRVRTYAEARETPLGFGFLLLPHTGLRDTQVGDLVAAVHLLSHFDSPTVRLVFPTRLYNSSGKGNHGDSLEELSLAKVSPGESALGIGESESLSLLLWLESRAKVNTRNLFPLLQDESSLYFHRVP